MSLQPKFLKMVQAGYENYNGPIGAYEFVNGVSTVMIPRNDRDRLATAFQFVEFTEEGVDEVEAGVAARMLRDSKVAAEETKTLARQTEEEKQIEDASVVMIAEKPPVIYTRDELEKIADKKGINGLREIADNWKVKHRSILPLIALIEQAQNRWLAERQAAFEARGIAREAFEASLGLPTEPTDATEATEATEPVTPTEASSVSEVQAAAASGDMSAAVNQE